MTVFVFTNHSLRGGEQAAGGRRCDAPFDAAIAACGRGPRSSTREAVSTTGEDIETEEDRRRRQNSHAVSATHLEEADRHQLKRQCLEGLVAIVFRLHLPLAVIVRQQADFARQQLGHGE